MTRTTMTLRLECLGRELILGPGQPADITKVTGLEAPEIDVGLSDLAVLDGASHDGTHVKARPIHIEGSYKSTGDTEADRERLIRFFNPRAGGVLTATVGKRTRSIAYLLEGWTLKERRTLDVRVGFVVDLICPDPYLLSEPHAVALPAGKDVELVNDADQETGWTAEITSVGGTVIGPRIVYGDTHIGVQAGIAAGDTMLISTERGKQTVTLNGTSVFILLDRTSVPFKIPVGGCIIRADAEQNAQDMSCVITYHERFSGV